MTDTRTRTDFARVVRDLVDGRHRSAAKVVPGMDNRDTHGVAGLYAAWPPAEAERIADRPEVRHTPKHGSWLNVAEVELAVLARQCLNRRAADRPALAAELGVWQGDRNAAGSAVNWRFTTADARVKLERLYPVQVC